MSIASTALTRGQQILLGAGAAGGGVELATTAHRLYTGHAEGKRAKRQAKTLDAIAKKLDIQV